MDSTSFMPFGCLLVYFESATGSIIQLCTDLRDQVVRRFNVRCNIGTRADRSLL